MLHSAKGVLMKGQCQLSFLLDRDPYLFNGNDDDGIVIM